MASVVVLDTLHYGGVMTAYDAFGLAKPIVTLAGSNQRTRYATACYRQMGLTDCIATSPDEYVAIASRLGLESDYHKTLVDHVAEAGDKLFADETVGPAFVNVFRTLLTGIGRL